MINRTAHEKTIGEKDFTACRNLHSGRAGYDVDLAEWIKHSASDRLGEPVPQVRIVPGFFTPFGFRAFVWRYSSFRAGYVFCFLLFDSYLGLLKTVRILSPSEQIDVPYKLNIGVLGANSAVVLVRMHRQQ